MRWQKPPVFLSLAASLLAASVLPAQLAGDIISYQGRLDDGGAPANGVYDFEFRLFDDPTAGSQAGATFTADDLPVTGGLFSTPLDFGSGLFEQMPLFLEIGVRPGASTGAFETLGGRVELLPVPSAFFAKDSDTLDGMDSADFAETGHGHNLQDLSGAVTDVQVPDDITIDEAANADTLDGMDSTDFAEVGHGHNLQDLSGTVTDAQVPDDITIDEAANADTLDGMDSSDFALVGHGHSMLQSPDGTIPDVVSTDNNGDTTVSGSLTVGGATGATLFGAANGIIFNVDSEDVLLFNDASGLGLLGSRERFSLLGSTGGDVVVSGGDGEPDGTGDGGDVEITAGTGAGASSGTGGNGGNVRISAAPAQGSENNNGGSIFLQPAVGTNAGSDGSIYLYDRTIAGLSPSGGLTPFPLPVVFTVDGGLQLNGQVRDIVGSPGTGGQVLTTTGGGVAWSDLNVPDSDSLDSPSGGLTDVVATNNAGDTTFKGALRFNSFGSFIDENGFADIVIDGNANVQIPDDIILEDGERIRNINTNQVELSSDQSDGEFKFLFNSNADTRLEFGSGQGGDVYLQAATSTADPADKGEDLNLISGLPNPVGTGDGGDINLFAANGASAGLISAAGGNGGTVNIIAGDASGTGNNFGGDILLRTGNGVNLGADGLIFADGKLSVNQTFLLGGRTIDTSTGAHLTDGGVWTDASSRTRKTDFETVDAVDVLNRVLNLPVQKWRYKVEADHVRHMGPVAEDFMAAFGLGESDEHIASLDSTGVALAAIQGLHAETENELETLKAENAELRARLAQLESLVQQLAAAEAQP